MAIRDLGEDEARALVRSGFGRELRRLAATCCRPLFWYEPPADDASRILNFGTMSFVHTASGLWASRRLMSSPPTSRLGR
jgi:hypothetical protein